MASVAGFRRGLAKAVEALNYDVSGAAKGRVKSFAMKRLQPEISQIAHAVGEDAKKSAYTKAALVGAPAAAAAYLAGRKKKMEKTAGLREILSRDVMHPLTKSKSAKLKDFIQSLPDDVRKHLIKKVKSFDKKYPRGRKIIGTVGGAGLLAGSAGYAGYKFGKDE